MQMSTFELIYDVVNKIPKGMVASYGQVAALAGNSRWARVVGYALHACPEDTKLPWYRVVRQDGSVAFDACQRELLEREGVGFKEGKVIMEKYQWDTPWV